MNTVHTAILKARRRSLIDRSLLLGGWGALVGAMLGVVLLLVDRAFGLALPAWAYAVIVAVPAMFGVMRAAATLPDAFEVAKRLDRTLHLKDRIATAHVLSGGALMGGSRLSRTDDDFAALVRRDAEKLAGSIDARSAAPVRVTGVWGVTVAIGVALIAGILYLPPLAWGEADAATVERERSEEEAQEREELRADIERIIEDLREDALVDARASERLEALEQLREQLLADDPGANREHSALRDETAAHVNELAERLAEQARRDARAAEELAERFGRLEPPETPMSAAEFDEALRQGDFGRAAESLEDLLRRRDSLPPDERRELAEHLRELGDQVDRASESELRDLEERRAQLEQALRDQGIDEDALRELMEALHDEEMPPEELDRRLHEEMTDEELAQRLARELERLREQQRIEDRIEEDARSISESLREAADEMESTEKREPRHPDAEPPEQEADSAPDERTQPDQQEQPGEDREGEPQEGQREGEQREGEAQEEQPEGERPGEQPQESERPGEEGEQREGAARDPEGDESETGQTPGDPDGDEQPDEPVAEQADEDQQTGEEAERPRRRGDSLRDIEQRRQAAERRRETSERLREDSRRMADPQQDSREQRPMPVPRHDQRDGSEAGADGPRTPVEGDRAPFRADEVEDLDARAPDDDDPGEVIAEWLSDEPRELEPGAPRTGEAQQRVRQAQRIAERAVDEQAVPARYHDAIRRYFNRLNQAVERAQESSRPAGETSESNPSS